MFTDDFKLSPYEEIEEERKKIQSQAKFLRERETMIEKIERDMKFTYSDMIKKYSKCEFLTIKEIKLLAKRATEDEIREKIKSFDKDYELKKMEKDLSKSAYLFFERSEIDNETKKFVNQLKKNGNISQKFWRNDKLCRKLEKEYKKYFESECNIIDDKIVPPIVYTSTWVDLCNELFANDIKKQEVEKRKIWKCKKCDKRYVSKSSLTAHDKNNH